MPHLPDINQGRTASSAGHQSGMYREKVASAGHQSGSHSTSAAEHVWGSHMYIG